MKKLKRLIAAALCLALLGGSAALAEQTAYTLRICDPVVTTDGETTLDLTGVTLEAAAAQVQDGFELLLRALGGDQVAAEGVMRWDGSRVALDARGLDGYYTIGSTMDDHRTKRKKQSGFDAQFGLDSLLSDSFFSQLEQACDDYYDSYFQMLLDAQADEGEQTVEDFFTGPVKMHGTSYTLTTQQVLDVQTELTNAILEAMGLGGYYGLYSLGNVPYSVDALPEVETQTFDAEQAEFGSTFGKYDRRGGISLPDTGEQPEEQASDAEQAEFGSTFGKYDRRGEISLPDTGEQPAPEDNFKPDTYEEIPQIEITTLYAGDKAAPSALRTQIECGDMFFIRQDAELTSDGTYSLYAELSSDIDGDAFWLTMSGTGSDDYVVPGIFLEMDDYREMFEYAYDPSGMFAVTFEGEQTYNGETQKISGYVEYYAQGESPETPQASTLDLSIWLEDEEKVVLAGTAFHGYWWPADGVTYDYDEFYADLMLYTPQDDFNAELLVQNRHSGGQDGFYASLNLTDWLAGEAHSLYCQYDGSYEDNRFGGEDMRGTLELGYSQGLYETDTQTQISLDVELQQVALADVRFPALEGEAVDVFAMSDAETEKLTAECSVIGIQLLGILSANAPGAAELLADLIMQGVL